MTPDMAFECLFVSRDVGLFRTVGRILKDLSISTSVCVSPNQAYDKLGKGSTELVVIDWQGEESSEFLHKIWQDTKSRKPTVVAITSTESLLPGAHMVIKKPVTAETGEKSFKEAYSRMLVDYRRHVRHALMLPAVATFGDGRAVSVTVADIGDGGVGISCKQPLIVGDTLSFRVLLPGAPRDILVHVRVLWTREYGRVGCEFLRIPPVDLMILHDWLKSKARVKKPLIAD
jgi:hypothetical protein